MCGRYVIDPNTGWPRQMAIDEPFFDEFSDYNIAPSRSVPVLQRLDGQLRLETAHWGLVPGWQKTWEGAKHKPINARVETVAEKPMFREAFKRGRVVLPASGYYEWKPTAGTKQPFYLHPADGSALFFAGLLESWGEGENQRLSTTIITGPAEGAAAAVHDRMPVCLTYPKGVELWTGEADDPDDLLALLADEAAAVAATLEAYPVSTAVGNVRNNGPELLGKLS